MSNNSSENLLSDLVVEFNHLMLMKIEIIQQRIQTFHLRPKFNSMSKLKDAMQGVVASPKILAHMEQMICADKIDL
ncbi:hypothetical protein ACHAPJ_012781 [Fusarium lateritium]